MGARNDFVNAADPKWATYRDRHRGCRDDGPGRDGDGRDGVTRPDSCRSPRWSVVVPRGQWMCYPCSLGPVRPSRNAMTRFLIATAIVLAGVGSLAAQQVEINDQTTCAVAFHAYDAEDRPTVSVIAHYVYGVLDQLDRAHMAKGEVGILSAMSKDGLVTTSVTPIEMCRGVPTATLHSQIVKTYDGIRAAEQQMGTLSR